VICIAFLRGTDLWGKPCVFNAIWHRSNWDFQISPALFGSGRSLFQRWISSFN
jgi:hypothetical protein